MQLFWWFTLLTLHTVYRLICLSVHLCM